MRPALVAVGAVFALVGAAVIVAVLYPADAATNEQSGSVRVIGLDPGQNRTITIPAAAASSAEVVLRWISSAPVDVAWTLTTSCTISPVGWCFQPQPAAKWSSSLSGNWSSSGNAAGIYGLFVQDASNATVNFSASFSEVYHVSPLPLTFLPLMVVLAGGALLLGVGGVAVYLGLFLPTGVYGPIRGMPEVLFDDGPAGTETGDGTESVEDR